MDEKKMEGIELCERVNDEVYEIDQTLEAAGYGNRSQDFDNADGEFEEIDGEEAITDDEDEIDSELTEDEV